MEDESPEEVTELHEKEDEKALKQREAISRLERYELLQAFQGPLPHPNILKEYNDIIPNMAERLVAMVEEREKHDMEMESKIVREQIRQSRTGQWIGASITFILIIGGIVLVYMGHDLAGATISTGGVGGAAITFFRGKRKQQEESQQE